MDTHSLKKHFSNMGAKLDITIEPEFIWRNHFWRGPYQVSNPTEFEIDISEGRREDKFEIRIRSDLVTDSQILPLQLKPKTKHLLLMAKWPTKQEHEKFLCGFDERHWFVAGVDTNVTSISGAMDSLRPPEVIQSIRKAKVPNKLRNNRRNKAFLRQGEWFFVPEPAFFPAKNAIIYTKEPLRRGLGKPHMVDELHRSGGEQVYVNRQHPNGITKSTYEKLVARNPQVAKQPWSIMYRNPGVYVKGRVRHPDHATIVLPIWHRVFVNREMQSRAVAFLD